MNNMVRNTSIQSYFTFPDFIPYYMMVANLPVHADGEHLSQKNGVSSNNFHTFTSKMKGFYNPVEYNSSVHDSSNNLTEQHMCSEFQIDAPSHSEARTPTITSPIILSYNGQSSKWIQKESDVSLESTPQTKKQSPKQQVKVKVAKLSENDRDYHPLDRKKKTSQKYQENQNRNIIPNEINQIFSFIQKKNKSGHIVDKLFDKFSHPAEFTPKRFYLYQSLLKNKLGHYTNENSLKLVNQLYEPKCENWTEIQQRFYNKICRVLIHHFLHEDSIFIILTSKRMKSDKKADHMRARRQVCQSVLSILRKN